MLFYYIFYSLKKKTTFIVNFIFVLVGFLSLFILQTIKSEYREIISQESDINRIGTFTDLYQKRMLDSENLFNIGYTEGFVGRLNTGWVVAKIMYHIPIYEPYSLGEKLASDVFSSFVPRFMYPNKRKRT